MSGEGTPRAKEMTPVSGITLTAPSCQELDDDDTGSVRACI
jgi:hypothetical protein